MARTVTLRLAAFEHQALDRYLESKGGSASSVVRTAAIYYLRGRDSGRPAWRVPELPGDGPAAQEAFDVDLDDETWRSLADEAAAQGVAMEKLAQHALLFFLADVDSGRIAETLERVLRDE